MCFLPWESAAGGTSTCRLASSSSSLPCSHLLPRRSVWSARGRGRWIHLGFPVSPARPGSFTLGPPTLSHGGCGRGGGGGTVLCLPGVQPPPPASNRRRQHFLRWELSHVPPDTHVPGRGRRWPQLSSTSFHADFVERAQLVHCSAMSFTLPGRIPSDAVD